VKVLDLDDERSKRSPSRKGGGRRWLSSPKTAKKKCLLSVPHGKEEISFWRQNEKEEKRVSLSPFLTATKGKEEELFLSLCRSFGGGPISRRGAPSFAARMKKFGRKVPKCINLRSPIPRKKEGGRGENDLKA